MTKEEAKGIINRWLNKGKDGKTKERIGYLEGLFHDTDEEAFNMAIKALEQEPCEDAISRDAVLEKAGYTETEEGWSGYTVDVDYIKSLPSVKPQPKTEHCEDCKHFRKLPLRTDTIGKCIQHWGVCPSCDWYCADFEPQESEEV